MLVSTLSLFALVASAFAAQAPSGCTCSSGFIPVPVDVTIPVDPSNPNGLNTTNTFHLRATYSVYAYLCEPVSAASVSKFSSAVQLLLHGSTYTSQYWDVTWNGFRNYSYVAHSCSLGITSFAYDTIGAGRTTTPTNSNEAQIPTAASIASFLARGLKSGLVSSILTGTSKQYRKVIGYGHSLGSNTLNYGAIQEGTNSPFGGFVLTGMVHDKQFIIKSPVVALPASEVDPRWAGLDPGYIATPNISARSLFYGPDPNSFSPQMLQLDELTKDKGSRWISAQIKFTYSPSKFKGPVVEMVGSLDQAHCTDNNGTPCNAADLMITEKQFWPNSKNFTPIVIDGFGHDINLEFAAVKAFPIMTELFESFIRN